MIQYQPFHIVQVKRGSEHTTPSHKVTHNLYAAESNGISLDLRTIGIGNMVLTVDRGIVHPPAGKMVL